MYQTASKQRFTTKLALRDRLTDRTDRTLRVLLGPDDVLGRRPALCLILLLLIITLGQGAIEWLL
jgi:hypothetical protein